MEVLMAVIILLCTLAAISIVVWSCDEPIKKESEKKTDGDLRKMWYESEDMQRANRQLNEVINQLQQEATKKKDEDKRWWDKLREESKKTNSEKYAEKLEDPRWKAKRLEILKRDNCTCQWCGSTHNLQVHHHYYVWGREPWEYDDKALITVCRRCHKWWHSTHQNRVYGKYRRY